MLKHFICLYTVAVLGFMSLQAEDQPIRASAGLTVAKCKKCKPGPATSSACPCEDEEELNVTFLACGKCE